MHDPNTTMYALRVYATGEVRDADGNLIETVPVESTQIVDAETARRLMDENE
jgi:hypothetical protein